MAFEDMEITIGPAWTPRPEYTRLDQRPPAPEHPLKYPTEKAAEAALEALLSPFFTLYRQVRITETGYPPQFIDYVAVSPIEDGSLPFFGIEVKRGFDDVKGACDVIQQAMRYRKARMADPRTDLSRFLGDHLPFVFLWPEFRWAVEGDWYSRHANPDYVRARYLASCSGEARALKLFAGRYNIGHVVSSPWWSRDLNAWTSGVVLMNGQQQVWTSRWINQIEDGLRAGARHGNDPRRGLRYIE